MEIDRESVRREVRSALTDGKALGQGQGPVLVKAHLSANRRQGERWSLNESWRSLAEPPRAAYLYIGTTCGGIPFLGQRFKALLIGCRGPIDGVRRRLLISCNTTPVYL